MIHNSPATYDTGSMQPAGTPAALIRVSPSRPQIRRADPSVSFQIIADTLRYFDIIVATDPALFDPQNAHRRTHKNFRSSRQDFQGAPVEMETGFYMLPRAFIRNMVSVEPRPTRLYYIAVGYADISAQDGRYSVPVHLMAQSTPFISISDDLRAGSLAKVLGIAVENLGIVSAQGRVMPAMTAAPLNQLPPEIGGLPLLPAQANPPLPKR